MSHPATIASTSPRPTPPGPRRDGRPRGLVSLARYRSRWAGGLFVLGLARAVALGL